MVSIRVRLAFLTATSALPLECGNAPMICDGGPPNRYRNVEVSEAVNSGSPSLDRISLTPKVANIWRRQTMRPVAPGYDLSGGVLYMSTQLERRSPRRQNDIRCNRRSRQKLTQTESAACQAPLEESQHVMVLFCCINLESPEWRRICAARIRSNRNVIPSMTLSGGQNGEFEVNRCEWREELPPDPGIEYRMAPFETHWLSRYIQNAATVSSVSRRVSGKRSSMATMRRHMPRSDDISKAMRSQDSAVNDEALRRIAAIIALSAESVPEHRVRHVSFAHSLCDGGRHVASAAVFVFPGRCATSKYQGGVRYLRRNSRELLISSIVRSSRILTRGLWSLTTTLSSQPCVK